MKPDSPIFIVYWNKGKINPLTIKGINTLFDDFSLDAFGDLEIKRFSPHDTREFFQSALENAGVQANIISPIMAHKVKGVDQHYSSHDYKELLIKYESALPWLLPQTVEKVKSELEETKTELNDTKKLFEQQNKQIEELRESIKGLYHIQGTYPTTIRHTLLNKKTGKMEEYSETVNNLQEEEEAIKKFEEKAKKLSES